MSEDCNLAEQIQCKTVDEVRNVSVSFDGRLDSGIVLIGAPTVVELYSIDLTISNIIINTAILTINGVSVPIGKAVQFAISSGIAGNRYTIKITAASDASPPEIHVGYITLDVEE